MKNLRLRSKFLIIVLIASIPMFVLHSVTIADNRRQAIDQELLSNKEYAEAVATTFTNFLSRVWHTESIIGNTIINCHDFVKEDIDHFLQECASGESMVSFYAWLSPEGQIVNSSDKKYIRLNLGQEGYFQEILRGKEQVVSSLYIDSVSQSSGIAILKAVRANDRLEGVVFAYIENRKLVNVMPTKRSGKTSALGIIDNNGAIVYVDGEGEFSDQIKYIRPDSIAWQALAGEVTYLNNYITSFDSDPRIGAVVPIERIGWVAFATITTEEVLAWVNDEFFKSILIMVCIIILSFSCVIYFSIDLLKPIKQLEDAARGIASRDFKTRTNIKRKDEFGQIGLAFDRMAERVEELEHSRILFLQSAAHELRNPITSVKGITSLIYNKLKTGQNIDNLIKLIEVLNEEVSRLALLLNELIEGFRAEQQNFRIKDNMKVIDMVEVVKPVVSVFQLDTTNNRTIVFNCAEEKSYKVMGDPERLTDVIVNLIGNAIKYSPENTEIKISCKIEDESVVVSVKDQGRGIPEEELTNIFNSFHRVKSSDNEDPGGLGLGLFICKDIILRHGGKIWAENNTDRGSTFFIKLPLYKPTN